MKGLMRNIYYSIEKNILMSFLVTAVLLLVPLVIGSSDILSMVIAIQLFMFVSNTGSLLYVDETSAWNKFELTLPIKKKTVISAKFMWSCILILAGLFMAFLTCTITFFATPYFDLYSVMWGFQYGFVLSVVTTAITYPATLKMGPGKNELILIMAAIVSLVYIFLVAAIYAFIIGEEMNLRSPEGAIVSIGGAVILLVISYVVSVRIYKNKQF